MAGLAVTAETETYIEYTLTLHIPPQGFPEGLEILNELAWCKLEDGTIVYDKLSQDTEPEFTGLSGDEHCELTVTEREEDEEAGDKVSFTMYQNYTDETNNTPGLAPGARDVQIVFRATKGQPWPADQERVMTLTMLFEVDGKPMMLSAEISNKATKPVELKMEDAVLVEVKAEQKTAA